MDRLFLHQDNLRVAQQLLNLRGSRDCQRCGGLLVPARMDSPAETLLEQYISGLRCVQCGDVVDHIILRNRLDPAAARRQDPKDDMWEDEPEELRLCATGHRKPSRHVPTHAADAA